MYGSHLSEAIPNSTLWKKDLQHPALIRLLNVLALQRIWVCERRWGGGGGGGGGR